jgi:hypothetical protein
MKRLIIIGFSLVILISFPGNVCFAERVGSARYYTLESEVLSSMSKPHRKMDKSKAKNKHQKNDRKSKRLKKAYDCGCK